MNRVLLQSLLASVLMHGVSVAWAGNASNYPDLQAIDPAPTWFLSTNAVEKIGFKKRSLTSSLGDENRFRVNIKHTEKQPGWRGGDTPTRDAELAAEMQVTLFDSLKFYGAINSRVLERDNNNPQMFDAGSVNSPRQTRAIDPYRDFDTDRSNSFAHTGKHFIKLEVTGKQGGFGYGTRYLSMSEGYKSLGKKINGIKQDQARHKSFVSWGHGDLRLKTSYSDSWDNIGEDPGKSRKTDRLVRITPSYTLHEWPYVGVSVSYGQGSRASSIEPDGKQRYEGPLSEISTSFNVSTDTMDLYLGASLDESSNDLFESRSSKTVTYSISGSYYPFDSIYITPDFSISLEEYLNGSQVDQYTSTNGSISLTYMPSEQPYSLSLYAGHDSYEGTDGYTDTDYINATLSLDWEIKKNHRRQGTLSFEVSHDSYTDHIYSDSSSSDLTAGVVWRWTGR